jgi:hypothetical protein
MDIRRKVELAQRAIEMVARHDTVDLGVREVALQQLGDYVESQRKEARERVLAEAKQALGLE